MIDTPAPNGYYPVALRVAGRRCVIVGGGAVAERKLRGLIEAGADTIVLISPDVTENIRDMALRGQLKWINRNYEAGDLVGAWLVIASSSDGTVNKSIAAEAEELGILSNIADDAQSGSYITPAVVRRGDLLISVTASGASPSLAKVLKKELEAQYGDRYERAVQKLRELRELALQQVENEKKEAILRHAAEEVLDDHIAGLSARQWLDRLLAATRGGS
ncbi:bifunctional precorrin-2 dehydrogenase/sirohydrochlorin ferrochelatase [Paenibacillus sp. GCM10027627]|uniref:precorrin-2 dehydrogenase/sirohydrochlorin ferrochelatase family protein n=1 Tax=unclassified Paenibacillus TaxID=185978 RepID=UPI00363F1160